MRINRTVTTSEFIYWLLDKVNGKMTTEIDRNINSIKTNNNTRYIQNLPISANKIPHPADVFIAFGSKNIYAKIINNMFLQWKAIITVYAACNIITQTIYGTR